jgi:hypothetical protein
MIMVELVIGGLSEKGAAGQTGAVSVKGPDYSASIDACTRIIRSSYTRLLCLPG